MWNRGSKSASKRCLDSLQYWACVHAEITGTAATVPILGSREACVCNALPLPPRPTVTLQHSHANAFILSNWILRQLIRQLRYPDEPNKAQLCLNVGCRAAYVDLFFPALQSLLGQNLVALMMLTREDVEGKCLVFELTFIFVAPLRRWMQLPLTAWPFESKWPSMRSSWPPWRGSTKR